MQTRTDRPAHNHTPCRSPALLGTFLLAALFAGGLGCQKTALRPDDTRSQFDRYDQSRSQRAQPFLEDEFGRRTPNLKDRLLVDSE
jgi:hypothetical protein